MTVETGVSKPVGIQVAGSRGESQLTIINPASETIASNRYRLENLCVYIDYACISTTMQVDFKHSL